MRALGVIVARGSSKRLPRKNIRMLLGAPLLAHMCTAARGANLTRVIVSTEDDEIASVARTYGVEAPFRRPDALATDWARSEDIVLHAVDWLKSERGEDYDAAVLMQPTTPFVLAEQIHECAKALEDRKAKCCFAAVKASKPPEWMFVPNTDGTVSNFLNERIAGDKEHSQLLGKKLVPTGAAYAVEIAAMREQKRIICDPTRVIEVEPRYAIDIDDELDLQIAEAVGRFYAIPTPQAVETGGER